MKQEDLKIGMFVLYKSKYGQSIFRVTQIRPNVVIFCKKLGLEIFVRKPNIPKLSKLEVKLSDN